jgi:hypothetical protein
MQWPKNYLIQFILFQMQWWCCVLGAKYSFVWPAVVFIIAIWLIEIFILRWRWPQIRIILLGTLLGVFLDSAQTFLGIITFPTTSLILNYLIPVWLIMLWLAFNSWVFISSWLKEHKILVSIGTLVLAPASYWAGSQLGVIDLPYGLLSLCSIASCWLLFINLVLRSI